MAIVDLRGRAHDLDVRELVRLARLADGRDQLESRPLLVGWSEGEDVIGGVGAERAHAA